MKLLLPFLLLLAACNGKFSHGHDSIIEPVPVTCDVTEKEPNNTLQTANFVAVLTPPDQVFVCGVFADSIEEEDHFWFFTPVSELVSFVVTSEYSETQADVLIFSNSLTNPDELTILGHFVGSGGKLVVLNWPVFVEDNGFFLSILGLGEISKYQIEIWSTGIIVK